MGALKKLTKSCLSIRIDHHLLFKGTGVIFHFLDADISTKRLSEEKWLLIVILGELVIVESSLKVTERKKLRVKQYFSNK